MNLLESHSFPPSLSSLSHFLPHKNQKNPTTHSSLIHHQFYYAYSYYALPSNKNPGTLTLTLLLKPSPSLHPSTAHPPNPYKELEYHNVWDTDLITIPHVATKHAHHTGCCQEGNQSLSRHCHLPGIAQNDQARNKRISDKEEILWGNFMEFVVILGKREGKMLNNVRLDAEMPIILE